MKIEILGSGCANCRQLEQNAIRAAETAGIDAQTIKIQDMEKIMSYGIMMTPGLVVNGKVKSSGQVLKVEEIIPLLEEEASA
ncbi:MAG: TM0996/MTH895 family glutaredoxin-like protein [Spirochaetales bacterium]|nr:TM0996/MTH895 family glutaredoxin-like protein [Spirochaetales bacterium]